MTTSEDRSADGASQANRPNAVGHTNPATAILTGITDLFRHKEQLDPASPDERLDGKTALITGANTGLGKAVAIQLAQRGAHVLMACRGGHPEAGEEVKRASGSDTVEMLRVDLSDLTQVVRLSDELRARNQAIDLTVLNAGLMPARARHSAQGFELMFAVHFLANRLLVRRMLEDGVIRPTSDPAQRPRIVVVASEAHRSARPIDFDHFGEFVDYGIRDGMAEYGQTKLHLCTWTAELARRLNPDNEAEPQVDVLTLCPGPIASSIARDAPVWLKPIVPPLLKLFFPSPEKAAGPVVLLACGHSIAGRNGLYLHMFEEKPMSELAMDPMCGRLIWEKSEALLKPHV